jgi:hypothetical protein
MPANSVTRRPHSDVYQPLVIGFGKFAVARRGNDIKPLAAVVTVCRTLKTAHQVTLKNAFFHLKFYAGIFFKYNRIIYFIEKK